MFFFLSVCSSSLRICLYFVCLNVYVFLIVCIFLSVYLPASMSYVCLFTSLDVCLSVCFSAWRVCILVWLDASPNALIYLFILMHQWMSNLPHACINGRMWKSICVYIHTDTYASMCAYARMYVKSYIHMCIYSRMHGGDASTACVKNGCPDILDWHESDTWASAMSYLARPQHWIRDTFFIASKF